MLIATTKKGEKAREACKYMLSSHYKPFALVCFHCYACQLCAFIVFMKITERHFPFPINRKTLLEIRHMDDVSGNLFSLFCPTWCEVSKMFARFFGLSQWRHSLLHSRSLCCHAALLPTNGCWEPNHIPFPLCLWSNEQTNHVQKTWQHVSKRVLGSEHASQSALRFRAIFHLKLVMWRGKWCDVWQLNHTSVGLTCGNILIVHRHYESYLRSTIFFILVFVILSTVYRFIRYIKLCVIGQSGVMSSVLGAYSASFDLAQTSVVYKGTIITLLSTPSLFSW